MKYPSAARITRRQEIDRIRTTGRTLKSGALVARVSPSHFSSMRVGVIVPRFGHTAVDRNRLKRQLRELVRTELLPRGHARDIVIWARAAAYGQAFANLRTAIRQLGEGLEMGETPAQ